MSESPSDAPTALSAAGDHSEWWRAIVVIAVAVCIATFGVLAVRPHVLHWLNVRDAYRKLDSPDRTDAVAWLIRNGEDPDEALLAMLDSPDELDRFFAAEQLSNRPAKPEITGALIQIVESSPSNSSVTVFAIIGLGRRAEAMNGPLEAIDHRIISVLTPLLVDQYVKHEAAQVLAEYLPSQASLNEPLEPFLYAGRKEATLAVARGCYRSDPRRKDMYFNRLVRGVTSREPFAVERATQYLQELGPNAQDMIPRLLFAREKSPLSAKAIDRAIAAIEASSRRTD